MGLFTNPKKSLYNSVYNKTTFSLTDLFNLRMNSENNTQNIFLVILLYIILFPFIIIYWVIKLYFYVFKFICAKIKNSTKKLIKILKWKWLI